MIIIKKCRVCLIEKNVDDFYKSSSRKDGRQSDCKKCRSDYQRVHYNKNKKRYLNNKSNRVRIIKDGILALLLTSECAICGEDSPECLDFDHIENKKFNISQFANRGYNQLIKEIKKCQILCSNCHRKKTAADNGWYQNKNKVLAILEGHNVDGSDEVLQVYNDLS